jgi:hypothetical protein
LIGIIGDRRTDERAKIVMVADARAMRSAAKTACAGAQYSPNNIIRRAVHRAIHGIIPQTNVLLT